MSESATPLIFPVHTGTGDQSNNFTVISNDEYRKSLRSNRGRLRTVAQDDLNWLDRRFLEPPDYGYASDRLVRSGCVVLVGSRGIGKHAAARMLLYRLTGPDVPIRDVPLEPDEPDGRVLDGTTIEAGDRLVVNLADTDDLRYQALLAPYRAEAREREAHLVVVFRSGQETSLPAEFASLIVEIGRPSRHHVLLRHLRADGIRCEPDQLHVPELAPHLATGPIRDLAELAKWIRTARERAAGRGTFEEWLRSAIKALADKDADVAMQLRALDGGRQRALLLAVAMLSGASPDAVCAAATTLLTTVEHPADERPLLERPGVIEQLEGIGVSTGRSDRVEFDTLNYDRAVRAHFWTNYPDLRDSFLRWADMTVRLPSLTEGPKNAFVERFAEQVLRTGLPDDLIVLAQQWARTNPELLPHATRAMELGSVDARYGSRFRRQLYKWATDNHLDRGLVDLVIRTCAGVLSLTHPEQALVRLHHLARRQGGAALDALLDLVRDDDRLVVHLLRRLSDSGYRDSREVDRELFRSLADPTRLTETTRADLVAGWQTLLAGPIEVWTERLYDWLAAGGHHDLLLTVLVEACEQQAELFGRLYLVARDWAREPGADQTERARIADRLFVKIDSAQGIGP